MIMVPSMHSANSPTFAMFSIKRSLRIIGNAAVTWIAAVAKGRKNTVRIWERMVAFTSSLLMPTFSMMTNRSLSS